MKHVDDAEEKRALEYLFLKLKQVKGLDFSQYRPACLKRRVDTRLRAHHLQNYHEYLAFLAKHPEEFDKLLDAATINVSEFFRDKDCWYFVEHTLLPAIIKKKKDKNQTLINIWSAGCSSGEEAYTLAIICHELLKEDSNFHIRIYGTDIDRASLKSAKDGCYSQESVQNVDQERLQRYFDFDGKQYKVNKSLQLMASFHNSDLIQAAPLKKFDFIVCRNVLIYFSKELQQKIMEKFNKALNSHGYLMLGKTETYGPHMSEYFRYYNPAVRVYQKR